MWHRWHVWIFLLQKNKKDITSRGKSLDSFAENPPSATLYPLQPSVRQMCWLQQIPVLYQLLLENLFALPHQGEGASPPFWLLFSAPALSQHSVSSSQSPCQQDFTQWPGELQSVAQPHSHTATVSHADTHTKTHNSLQTHLLHSPDKLVNRHLMDMMCEQLPKPLQWTQNYNIKLVNEWPTT